MTNLKKLSQMEFIESLMMRYYELEQKMDN